MKHLSLIFSAAAAVVATLFGIPPIDDPVSPIDMDLPSPIPKMTARLVEQYALAGGSDTDIADRFLVDEETIRTRYAGSLRVARALRRIAIHTFQFDTGKKLNSSMLAWLGRNVLSQCVNPISPGKPMPEVFEDA